MSDQKWHISMIVTLASGYLLGDYSTFKRFLSYMVNGFPVFDHQIPRVMDECKPYILAQFPGLKGIDQEIDAAFENVARTQEARERVMHRHVISLEARFGGWHSVEPIPMDAHDYKNPVDELEDMVGENRVIVVNTSEDES